MNSEHEKTTVEQPVEDETIDNAFLQMEILYKSRCVQAPLGRNVTIREIEKKEQTECQTDRA